jgi:uncharacterized protein YjeT (DUF2065 family)
MFDTSSMTELFMQAFGLYFLATGLGLVLAGDAWRGMIEDFKSNRALGFVAGVFTFALGVTILALHNDWSGLEATIVTAIGWATLIKGLVYLVMPGPMISFAASIFPNAGVIRIGGFVIIVLGAWMLGSGLGMI